MRDALVRVALIAWGGIALSATVPDAAYAASSQPRPKHVNVPVGPTQVSIHSTLPPQSTNVPPRNLAAPPPPTTAATPPVFPGPARPATASAATPGVNLGRITEIVPPASYRALGQAAGGRIGATPGAFGAAAWSSADPCVNVFVRSAKLDGREVVSVDLHGDGLIKGAVSPQLAGELLARAGPPTGAGGARAACVPTALAQRLFDPVINLAAVDPAVRMMRVGDHWVLAGSRAPEPVAKAPAPVQLAAAATRGAAKKQAKRSSAPKPQPVQVSYNIYP